VETAQHIVAAADTIALVGLIFGSLIGEISPSTPRYRIEGGVKYLCPIFTSSWNLGHIGPLNSQKLNFQCASAS